MRFSVPQFIDVEDKIFGPLTFRQFIYLVGGGGLSFICFKLLPIYFAIFPVAFFVVLALALAFYKVNNKPFLNVIESAFTYYVRDKLYLWKKDTKKREELPGKVKKEPVYIPTMSTSKLHDISWGLDVLGSKPRE